MQALELKIPPVVQVLVTGALMWALAVAVPVLGFAFAFSGLLALVLGAMGIAFALLGVWVFRSACTTVDPRAPDQSASLVLLPVFVVYMNRFQIIPEERYMREKFGDAYRRYESEVRRWI